MNARTNQRTKEEKQQKKTDTFNAYKSRYKSILELMKNETFGIKHALNGEISKINHTFILLEKYNVSSNNVGKILNYLKVNKNVAWVTNYLLSNIFVNPFCFLTMEVTLLRFQKCMKIKNDMNLTVKPEDVVRGWLSDCFIKEFNKFYEEFEYVKARYKQLFALPTSYLTQNLRTIYLHRITREVVEKSNIHAVPYVTTEYFIQFEKQLGEDILNLFYDDEPEDIDTDKVMDFICDTSTIEYNEQQKEAVKNALKYKGSIINGAPGTGKSTILTMVNRYMEETKCDEKLHIYNLGPTGLAAKNLHKCGGCCSTIHAFINKMQSIQYTHGVDTNIHKSHIHINMDESSMVNMLVFRDLISTIMTTQKMFKARFTITFVGDISQLPPIGIGFPFKSIIDTGLFPVTELTVINRANDVIGEKITKMNTKKRIARNDFERDEFRFIETDNFTYENIESIMRNLNYTPNNTHVLIPQHDKDQLCDTSTREKVMNMQIQGIESTNYLLQRLWNNSRDGYTYIKSQMVAVGDRVVRTVNDYKDENCPRANGDSGEIFGIDIDKNEVTVRYYDLNRDGKVDTEVVSYDEFDELFKLFYASSVHKMQGSEKDNIVIIVHPSHRWNKKLIYTAISRAKSNCTIIGNFQRFFRAQEENDERHFTYFMREYVTLEVQ